MKKNYLIPTACFVFVAIFSVSTGFAAWTYANGSVSDANVPSHGIVGPSWPLEWQEPLGCYFNYASDGISADFDHVLIADDGSSGFDTSNGAVTAARNTWYGSHAYDYRSAASGDGYAQIAMLPDQSLNGDAITKTGNSFTTYGSNFSSITTLYVPSDYTEFTYRSFYWNKSIKQIIFFTTDSMVNASSFSFGTECFKWCTSLRDLYLPNVDTLRFGSWSFARMNSLTLHYPKSISHWDAEDNNGDSLSLWRATTVTVECTDGQEIIYGSEVGNASNERVDVTFHPDVTQMPDYCFYWDDDIRTVNLPTGFQSIGNCALGIESGKVDTALTIALNYPGTYGQWQSIRLGSNWHLNRNVVVYCSDNVVQYPAS